LDDTVAYEPGGMLRLEALKFEQQEGSSAVVVLRAEDER